LGISREPADRRRRREASDKAGPRNRGGTIIRRASVASDVRLSSADLRRFNGVNLLFSDVSVKIDMQICLGGCIIEEMVYKKEVIPFINNLSQH